MFDRLTHVAGDPRYLLEDTRHCGAHDVLGEAWPQRDVDLGVADRFGVLVAFGAARATRHATHAL